MSASLKKLAQIVGVSPVTVYRAVSGKGYVNPELKKRICDLAQKHRYEPNILAKGVLKGKTKTIGIIVTDISSPHIAMGIQGAVATLKKQDYRAAVFCSEDDPRKEFEEIRQAAMRRVDGIIMLPCREAAENEHFDEILARGIPTVLLGMPVEGVAFDVFTGADEPDGYRLTQKLIACGHRKIAHLPIPVDVSSCKRRTNGWRKAMEEIGEEPDKWLITRDVNNSWHDGVMERLESNDPPTAIFASYEAQVADIYSVAARLNLKIGKDLSVATFFAGPGYTAARVFPPFTSGIIGPAYELGRQAADRLFELIALKSKKGSLHYKGEVTEIPGEWFEGGSIADMKN